jgi:cholesterol oxidase
MAEQHADWDVVVVGSGFGGSVAALRAVEKGYSVLVVEAGRRWRDEDFPKTNWDPRSALWAPALGMYGTWRITPLEHSIVFSAAGVGGGSLVYANTLYQPTDAFFSDRQWGHITDWKAELAPYYDQATRMLGVNDNPVMTPADEAIRQVAEEMGRGHTFRPTPVGVLFGQQEGEPLGDPFFGGAGPQRHACTFCGGCMVGCRYGAKNTMVKNYLYLAEQAGARVAPMTTVKAIRPRGERDGYLVDLARTDGAGAGARKTISAEQVVLAAGALGTQRLLQEMKADGLLPHLSDHLGEQFRTNSEELIGLARSPFADGPDHSRGVAITSSFYPDESTHIEPTRFPKGANLMALLGTYFVDGDLPGEPEIPRWRRYLAEVRKRPLLQAHATYVRGWSERGVFILIMQDVDNALRVSLKVGPLGMRRLSTTHGDNPPPRWIPIGHRATRRLAEIMDAEPLGPWTDIVDIPFTAHILGGAAIGDSEDTGTIDPWHRVYGYPGLHITDGSAVSANLGVNPSLTITAQAERAMSFWPNKGQDDPRPPLGADYVQLSPVAPKNPVVHADAPGALRLPA